MVEQPDCHPPYAAFRAAIAGREANEGLDYEWEGSDRAAITDLLLTL